MASLRRNLRLFAAIWLVFQVAWLTAFVPRDCCAAHRPADHHASQADGVAQHHHDAAAEHHAPSPPSPSNDCRMSGACGGPMAALLALLSTTGILPQATDTLRLVDLRPTFPPFGERATGRFEPPDAPPPRA